MRVILYTQPAFLCLPRQACEAVRLACRQLVERLEPFTKELQGTDYNWATLVGKVVSPMAGVFPKVS